MLKRVLRFESEEQQKEQIKQTLTVNKNIGKLVIMLSSDSQSQNNQLTHSQNIHQQKHIDLTLSCQAFTSRNTYIQQQVDKNKHYGEIDKNKNINKLTAIGYNSNSDYQEIINLQSIKQEKQTKIQIRQNYKHILNPQNSNNIENKYKNITIEEDYKKYQQRPIIKLNGQHQIDNIQQNNINNSQLRSQLSSDSQTCQQNYNDNIFQRSENQRQNALLHPTQKDKQLNLKLALKIININDDKMIHNFVITPIPNSITFQFEIHQHKSFFRIQYQFWFVVNGTLKLLMKAESSGINLDRTAYLIYEGNNTNKYNLIARLISDFKRMEYILYDDKDIESQGQIYGCIHRRSSLQHDPIIQLYTQIIKQDTNKFQSIYQNKFSNSLRQLRKIGSYYHSIKKYSSTSLSASQWFHISQKSSLIKSKRTLLMLDQFQNMKIFIGKKQSNRFKIICGNGISPLQLFSLSITQINK